MITSISDFRKINEKESPDPKFKHFDPKDKKRIEDIVTKSDKSAKKKEGNFSAVKDDKAKIKKEEEAKAQQMANAITGFAKAMRRGNAAKALGKDKIANIFFKKAKLLKESIINENVSDLMLIPELKEFNDAFNGMIGALKAAGIDAGTVSELFDAYDEFGKKVISALGIDESKINENSTVDMSEFTQACERYDFYGAFEIAQDKGLFDGDFDEYIESRRHAGSTFDNMIKLYTTYQNAASQLKDLIMSDIEDAQTNHGIPENEAAKTKDEEVYISYLNKAIGFKEDKKSFKGKDAYDQAVKWGRKNLENFNSDMIHYAK